MEEGKPGNTRELTEDDLVDEASAESFPASDAPGYRSSSIGGRAADFDQPRSKPDPQKGS